jgi:hypothetical protein
VWVGGIRLKDVSNWDVVLEPLAGVVPKLKLAHGGARYILKFSLFKGKREIPYYISEYASCKVAKSLGYLVQDVELATFRGSRGTLIRMFDEPVITFTGLGSSTLSGETLNYDIDLLFESVEGYKFAFSLIEYVYKTFLLDSFVCNLDRHPNNWGFFKRSSGMYVRAPLFDLSSSLFSLSAAKLHGDSDVVGLISAYGRSAIKFKGEACSFRDVLLQDKSEQLRRCIAWFKQVLKNISLSSISDVRKFAPEFSGYCDFLEKFFEEQTGWYEKVI